MKTANYYVTTFITPHDRFKYLRAPYGISSISEHYDRRMAEAFTGLIGFRHIVDDIVIYDSDPQHTQPMSCNSYNDVQTNTSHSTLINANSARLRSPLQDLGYLPKVTKLTTQLQMQYPSSPSLPTGRICAFFGLVNQLSSSTSEIASLLTPLRPLLSTKNDFT